VPIQRFQHYFIPILRVLDSQGVMHRNDLREAICVSEGLSEEESTRRNDRGTLLIGSRVHWAASYLYQAGAVDRPQRGYVEITDRGRGLIASHPEGIDVEVLKGFDEMREWLERTHDKRSGRKVGAPGLSQIESGSADDFIDSLPPIEQIENAIGEVEAEAASELVRRLHAAEPSFLEHVVLELLLAMGYGGVYGESEHLGRTGDKGVDGVIKRDALGLERIYVQAKRYAPHQAISGDDIRSFFGSLHHFKAASGVFITTSRFTDDAVEFAEGTSPRIVLIDGAELGALMVEHQVGVQVRRTLHVVEVDEDFFDQ
jgi:restriction system protein